MTVTLKADYMALTLSCFILGAFFFLSFLFSRSSIFRCFSGSCVRIMQLVNSLKLPNFPSKRTRK